MKLLLVLAISTILGITNVSTEEPSIEEPPGMQLEASIKPVIKEKKKAVSKPAPKPKVVPVAPSVSEITGSCATEVKKYDWPQEWAMNVLMKESGGVATKLNNTPATGDYSVGCFQINLYGANAATRPSEAWLKIASNNVALAHEWFVRDGRTFCGQWVNTC
jgi:hypothetical protein